MAELILYLRHIPYMYFFNFEINQFKAPKKSNLHWNLTVT
jgi:hypothetical protein